MLAFANLHGSPATTQGPRLRVGGAGLKPLHSFVRRTAVRHPQYAGEFALRRLDGQDDASLVHRWFNDAEVAEFWKMAWPEREVKSYLERQHASVHSAPCIGELDGVPMSYWELYRADLDPLARHYPAREFDAGVHLLLGPARFRGRGLAVPLLSAVARWLLDADPRVTRVVAEPDVENRRSIRSFERAGFRRAADITLPTKRAALMILDRPGGEPDGQEDYVSLS
jgi:RimJ/RimL family protein N-acetyltransferase